MVAGWDGLLSLGIISAEVAARARRKSVIRLQKVGSGQAILAGASGFTHGCCCPNQQRYGNCVQGNCVLAGSAVG